MNTNTLKIGLIGIHLGILKNKICESMEEKRKHARRDSIAVQIKIPGLELFVMYTANVSEGGMFLEANEDLPLPEEGTELIVMLHEELAGENPPALKARVVHRNEDGIGIEFTGTA